MTLKKRWKIYHTLCKKSLTCVNRLGDKKTMEENQIWKMEKGKIIFNWEAVKYRPDFIKRGLILFGHYTQGRAIGFNNIETHKKEDREKLINLIKKHFTIVNT